MAQVINCPHNIPPSIACYICELEAENKRLHIGLLAIKTRTDGSTSGFTVDGVNKIALNTLYPEVVGDTQDVYGSTAFPYVYHEDHVDGRTLVPEYVARNLRRGDR